MTNAVYYSLGALAIAGVLAGIVMMSRVKTARAGNALGAACVALAIIAALSKYGLLTSPLALMSLAVGLLIGVAGAARVKMIEMPQVVALLNGLGGLASALVALTTVDVGSLFERYAALAALAVGAITFSGSAIAAAKLARLIGQKPITVKYHGALTVALMLLTVLGAALRWPWLTAVAALAFGAAFAVRVGGADMPITISLLNSLSGVAGGIAGIAVSDPVLTCIGGVVGASGLLLTQIMCRSMNRSLAGILLARAAASAQSQANAAPAPAAVEAAPKLAPDQPAPEIDRPETDQPASDAPNDASEPASCEAEAGADDIAEALRAAKDVIIVPGYGMALAQAQESVKALADRFEARGARVRFAIHPVAGRMPGHMNVLLCEADVPYEQLFEMDDINGDFAACDLAIAVGANDTINPAANTAEGTPIYGMPVLAIGEAKRVIICNMDTRPGYAGVPNPLYEAGRATLLLGDANDSVKKLVGMLD